MLRSYPSVTTCRSELHDLAERDASNCSAVRRTPNFRVLPLGVGEHSPLAVRASPNQGPYCRAGAGERGVGGAPTIDGEGDTGAGPRRQGRARRQSGWGASGGSSVLEGVPIGLGAGVDHSAEMLTEVARGAEAALLSNGLDRQVADFEQSLSKLNALAQQPLVRGSSSGSEESAGKSPGTHGRPAGKILDGHRLIEMLLKPCNRFREQIGAVQNGEWVFDELGLAPIPLGRNNQLSGKLSSDLTPVVLANDVKAEVNASGTPGRREDVALVDIENPRVDRHLRVATGQLVAFCPMCRGTAPVEETSRSQDERPAAQRNNAASTRVG